MPGVDGLYLKSFQPFEARVVFGLVVDQRVLCRLIRVDEQVAAEEVAALC